jgi:hypothetical protein
VGDEIRAPDTLVDAIFHATADAGSIPAVSTDSSGCEGPGPSHPLQVFCGAKLRCACTSSRRRTQASVRGWPASPLPPISAPRPARPRTRTGSSGQRLVEGPSRPTSCSPAADDVDPRTCGNASMKRSRSLSGVTGPAARAQGHRRPLSPQLISAKRRRSFSPREGLREATQEIRPRRCASKSAIPVRFWLSGP